MYLREIVCGGVDWINLAQGRDRWQGIVDITMDLRVS
jgi:hypothetical protein